MTQLKSNIFNVGKKVIIINNNNNYNNIKKYNKTNRKLSQTRKEMRTKALRTSENELFIRKTKHNNLIRIHFRQKKHKLTKKSSQKSCTKKNQTFKIP